MKRILALLLTLSLVFALCACGGGKPESTPALSTESTPLSTPTPERLKLTSSMISECKKMGEITLGLGMMLQTYYQTEVRSIELVDQEQYDDYTYIFYYSVVLATSDYREKNIEVRRVFEAYNEKDDEGHNYYIRSKVFEGSNRLW